MGERSCIAGATEVDRTLELQETEVFASSRLFRGTRDACSRFVRRYWMQVLCTAWLGLGTGCTEGLVRRSSRGATAGALAAAEKHVSSSETGGVAGVAAKRVAAGAAKGLTTEERRADFALLSRDVAGGAAAGMKAELAAAIGPDGNGPLANRLAGTVERVTESAIFPSCTGPNRAACIHDQVRELSQSSATGFAQALRKELGLPALLLSFAAGVIATLAALSLWKILRAGRAPLHTAARSATS